jgi:hypothetical protein
MMGWRSRIHLWTFSDVIWSLIHPHDHHDKSKDAKIDKNFASFRSISGMFSTTARRFLHFSDFFDSLLAIFTVFLSNFTSIFVFHIFTDFSGISDFGSVTSTSAQSRSPLSTRNSWFSAKTPLISTTLHHHWILPILRIPAGGSIRSSQVGAGGAKKREKSVTDSSRRANCIEKTENIAEVKELFSCCFSTTI